MSFLKMRDDRGGVATLVAILLGGGVLLGMTAIVVDVGSMYAEREELQSGADAAATKLALACAKKQTLCDIGQDVSRVNTAELMSDKNASDGRSKIDEVCGWTKNGRLLACDPDKVASNLTDCIGTPPSGVEYVQVRTHTEVAESDYILPFSFAQAIAGDKGATIGACARVGWGAPQGGLGLTFSKCEWDEITNIGTSFAPGPPYTNATHAAYERKLFTHSPGGDPACPAGPSGWDRPGGFGWLDPNTGAPCYTEIDPDGSYSGRTGVPARSCSDALEAAVESKEPVLIPIYKTVRGNGTNTEYQLEGFAAFVITGYEFPSIGEKSWLTDADCGRGGSAHCIIGFFTQALVSGPIGPGPDLGATVIKTIG